MIKRSYFGNQNSTLGSVVPLAMFFIVDLGLIKTKYKTSLSWKTNFDSRALSSWTLDPGYFKPKDLRSGAYGTPDCRSPDLKF